MIQSVILTIIAVPNIVKIARWCATFYGGVGQFAGFYR